MATRLFMITEGCSARSDCSREAVKQMLGESAGAGPLVGDRRRQAQKGKTSEEEDGEEQVRRLR